MVKFYQNCCSPTKKNTEEKDTKKKGGGTRCNFQSNVNRVLIVHRGEYPQVHGDGKACKMKGKHGARWVREPSQRRPRKMKEKGNFIRNASGCGNPNLDLNSSREKKITTLLRLALMHSCPHWEAIRDCYGNPILFAPRPLPVHLTSVCASPWQLDWVIGSLGLVKLGWWTE